jgi:hypothetical protein
MPQYATTKRGAAEIGVSYRTFHDYISKGYFRVLKIDGIDSGCVDLVEVRAWRDSVARQKGTRRARPNYGSYGPDAKFVDLSNVVIDTAQVLK